MTRFARNTAFKSMTAANSMKPSDTIFIKFREGYRALLSDKQ